MASEIGIILGAIRRKNVNRAFHILHHCLIGNFTVGAFFGLGLNISLSSFVYLERFTKLTTRVMIGAGGNAVFSFYLETAYHFI